MSVAARAWKPIGKREGRKGPYSDLTDSDRTMLIDVGCPENIMPSLPTKFSVQPFM